MDKKATGPRPGEREVTIDLRDYSPVTTGVLTGDTENLKLDLNELCKEFQEQLNQHPERVLTIYQDPNRTLGVDIFHSSWGTWWTGRYTGILYFRSQRHQNIRFTVRIGSRFDAPGKRNFLNYMILRANRFSGKLLEGIDMLGSPEACWDVPLILKFFRQLKAALAVGVYKEYVTYERNDSRLSGPIDVPRHIRENMLFSGKIAYTKRLNTVDNDINRLILAALAYIRKKYPTLADGCVSRKHRALFAQLQGEVCMEGLENTSAILDRSDRPVTRHLYLPYEELRITSRLILRRLGSRFSLNEHGSMFGLALDMSKLWEELLSATVTQEFHYQTQTGFPLLLTSDGKSALPASLHRATPDMIRCAISGRPQSPVLDAKYKIHWGEGIRSEDISEDVNQILAYMLALNCRDGGAIFPVRYPETGSVPQSRSYLISPHCQRYFHWLPVAIPPAGTEEEERCFTQRMDEELTRLSNRIAAIQNDSLQDLTPVDNGEIDWVNFVGENLLPEYASQNGCSCMGAVYDNKKMTWHRTVRPDFIREGTDNTGNSVTALVVDADNTLDWSKRNGGRSQTFRILAEMLVLNSPAGAVVYPVGYDAPDVPQVRTVSRYCTRQVHLIPVRQLEDQQGFDLTAAQKYISKLP